MKKHFVTSALILAGLGFGWAPGAGAADAKTPIVWPAGEIQWADNPVVKGAKIAVLWGDPKTGPYGALKMLAGGSGLALHKHTGHSRVVGVSGTILLTLKGADPKELGPGSFAFIPGGAKHAAECKAGSDCIYFEEQQVASDIKFVEAAKK